MKLSKILKDVKEKIGPLWWYAVIIFCVQRFSDVLNVFAGLWLVPKYVPQAELGAVQPLTQIGGFLGFPLAVLVTPFIKLLNKHATNGDLGKVKALLRDAMILSSVFFIGIMTIARIFLPSILEFMRVEDGLLTMAVVFASVLGTLAPVFSGALQALKRFRLVSISGLFSAPLRFATLLFALPVRGLTGYFVGQSVPPMLTIGVTTADFFRKFGHKVKCEPYFRKDLPLFMAYLVPLSCLALASNLKGSLEMLTLRNLPDIHSAAHYHITRFSEIATYLVSPVIFVMFPLISEKFERGSKTHRVVIQTIVFTLAVGFTFSVALALMGPWIFSLLEMWCDYSSFTGLFGIATVTATLRMASSCFTTHEVACGRFRYAFYMVPISLLEAAFYYLALRHPSVLGVSIDTLGEFFNVVFVFTLIPFIAMIIDLFLENRRNGITCRVID